MEDNKHVGSGHVVHNTVVQLNRGGVLDWWRDHVLFPKSVNPGQHSTEVHALLPILVRLGVGALGRVTCLDSKVCTLAISSS